MALKIKQPTLLSIALTAIAALTFFLVGLFLGYNYSFWQLNGSNSSFLNQLPLFPEAEFKSATAAAEHKIKAWQTALAWNVEATSTMVLNIEQPQLTLAGLKVGAVNFQGLDLERIAPFYLTAKVVSEAEKEYRFGQKTLQQVCRVVNTVQPSYLQCDFALNKKGNFQIKVEREAGQSAELQLWTFSYHGQDYLMIGTGRLSNILDEAWSNYSFYYLDKSGGVLRALSDQANQGDFRVGLQGDFWLLGYNNLIWIIDSVSNNSGGRSGGVDLSVINTEFQDGLKGIYSFQTYCAGQDLNCPPLPQAASLVTQEGRLYLKINQADAYYLSTEECQRACPRFYWGAVDRLVSLEDEEIINSDKKFTLSYQKILGYYNQLLDSPDQGWLRPLLNKTLILAITDDYDRAWENFNQDFAKLSYSYPLPIAITESSMEQQAREQWQQNYINQAKRNQVINIQRERLRKSR